MKYAIELLKTARNTALEEQLKAVTSDVDRDRLAEANSYRKAIWWLRIYDRAATFFKKATSQFE